VSETGRDAAHRLGVTLLAHTHAVRICADTRQLRTTRGVLRYGHLVLAHGARAALPPGLPASLCWRVNHLDAYQRLRQHLGDQPKDVLIIGAGLIGSELANDLALGGHRITLLDTATEPLARWHDQQAGPQLLDAWKDLSIRFEGGLQVEQVERVGSRYRVSTTSGRRFAADEVVVAAGLLPPHRLAQSAGLDWTHGIAVDAGTLQTSVSRIHALGDCISIDGQCSRYIEPIARQARTLAADILGQPVAPYEHRAAVVRVKTTTRPLTLH
ncbi:MAG: FAD-dependent oxidoreductase, partial [Betaproteobacteria bacterium]